MATTNLFEKAKTVVPSPKSKLKKALEQRTQLNGWEMVARIRAMKDTLDAVLSIYEGQVKEQAKAEFIREGLRLKGRPAAIKAQDGIAEGQVILGKRKSNQPLEDLHIELFTKHSVSYTENCVVEETFRFNPKYINDQKLLADVSKKLLTIKGLPADLIEKQVGVKTNITTDSSLDEIFRLNQDIAEQLFDIVGNMSFRPVILEEKETDPLKSFKNHMSKVLKAFQ